MEAGFLIGIFDGSYAETDVWEEDMVKASSESVTVTQNANSSGINSFTMEHILLPSSLTT